jgi:hypothetical protein
MPAQTDALPDDDLTGGRRLLSADYCYWIGKW